MINIREFRNGLKRIWWERKQGEARARAEGGAEGMAGGGVEDGAMEHGRELDPVVVAQERAYWFQDRPVEELIQERQESRGVPGKHLQL